MSNDSNTPVTGEIKPEHLTDDSFASKTAKGYYFVDFWAEWCPPCKAISPLIDKLANKWAGKISFGKLDTDENPGIQAKYGVMSLPTFILFKDGEPIAQTVGAAPQPVFENFLNSNYKEDAPAMTA